MGQYDQTFYLKINVCHYDLYFTVQWFCLISQRLFDGCVSYFQIILWSSDFASYLEDYLIEKCCTWDNGSVWHKDWSCKIYVGQWLILLYKGLKGKASVPTDDLIPKTRRCRNQHSMAFQTPIANTDVYKGSFFPQTIRDWNALPDSLISSAEDAEDCVAKFTSLVRARD